MYADTGSRKKEQEAMPNRKIVPKNRRGGIDPLHFHIPRATSQKSRWITTYDVTRRFPEQLCRSSTQRKHVGSPAAICSADLHTVEAWDMFAREKLSLPLTRVLFVAFRESESVTALARSVRNGQGPTESGEVTTEVSRVSSLLPSEISR